MGENPENPGFYLALARVLRNMAIVKVDGRNFYDESMTKTMLGL